MSSLLSQPPTTEAVPTVRPCQLGRSRNGCRFNKGEAGEGNVWCTCPYSGKGKGKNCRLRRAPSPGTSCPDHSERQRLFGIFPQLVELPLHARE